ncbi:SnoaL-like domain-containing protein [Flavobacterium succinicans]|jgi:ketosteroid isomerase-like protein|uniref:SnoaL-like domain-containing protein n=1 Tax=Flavobacterium succinicans TaxID=29536 RepID=A0A1I4UXR8_9FLAO|nr:nuclear transport factor 2 family protein [Flavobacterium succinicans]SFM93716.1 SnoaL-like domain-containing protein [Flavobacterium succinicans]
MKKFSLSILILVLGVVSSYAQTEATAQQQVTSVLDSWHKAAAQAQFDAYFGLMTNDAIFIGTDANENWNKTAFQAFAKPYFDKGKAWNFTAIERHVYIDKSGTLAWFDELLSTQMKICRGSGVLVKVGDSWKIQHYVLSMTVPNENVDEVVKIKTPIEDGVMKQLTVKE